LGWRLCLLLHHPSANYDWLSGGSGIKGDINDE